MRLKTFFAIVFILCAAGFSVQSAPAEPSVQPHADTKIENHAFAPGEKLTYVISWSKVVDAGIAVMEVKDGPAADNGHVYRFVSSTRSVGLVESFYPVRDVIESVVDADGLFSHSFNLKESHGKKKRRKEITFDYERRTVRIALNDDQPVVLSVPGHMQDALSSLYYVRTRQDFIVGKPIFVNVVDGDKIWSVEVQTIGKERIKTPAGEFDTIKVKTYPKYEGVFMNKGEIYIWLTDDARKIPVLMKSIITIGSIVATLTDLKDGKSKP